RDEAKKLSSTGTHDLLLYRDIIEAMLYAAFEEGRVLGDADRVRDRLRHTCWRGGGPRHSGPDDARANRLQNDLVHADPARVGRRLFDANGDRQPGTGEHIVWLRPNFAGERLMPLQPATFSVWRFEPAAGGPSWYVIDSYSPPYNQAGG